MERKDYPPLLTLLRVHLNTASNFEPPHGKGIDELELVQQKTPKKEMLRGLGLTQAGSEMSFRGPDNSLPVLNTRLGIT